MIIVGDSIRDVYVLGKCTRLSPEAPVPVIASCNEEVRSGGAANVYMNYLSFDQNVLFYRNTENVSVKKRIYANGHLICRIDDERYLPYRPEFGKEINDHQYAIISDYGKGVIDDPQTIITSLLARDIKVLVDPKKLFRYYRNAWLIKANEAEFEKETGTRFDFQTAAIYCMNLCTDYNFSHIVITLGNRGCFHYDHDNRKGHLHSSKERTVVDVTGAGDVFMAALGYFVQKYPVHEACRFANDLAGVSVSHFGTYVLSKEDIAKVKPQLVFTNGCFDILHPGHIHVLKESKKLGNMLIVGINSDASVKRLKGDSRPILDQEKRKKMLEALGIADLVIIFEEDNPLELIKRIKPDIITKGGDYINKDQVVGNDLARVVIIPFLDGYSTTGVINAVKR